MNKIEYVHTNQVVQGEAVGQNNKPALEMQEDVALPIFTKELPLSKKQKESAGTITIDYSWGQTTEPSIKIKSIEFSRSEKLADIYRISMRDGVDTAIFKHNNSLYLIRKTTLAVAKALLAAYKKISAFVENVVGYFRTLLGTVYVVAKVEKGTWTFDQAIADYEIGVRYISPAILTETQKVSLADIIVQKLSVLHSRNLVLGGFSLKNVLLSNNNSSLTDLRNLRLTRKSSLTVEEFKNALRYLLSVGVLLGDNVYPAIASYCAANESACIEWHKERLGEQAQKDIYEAATTIEGEVYSEPNK